MLAFLHQYAYFFSLIFFILPVSLAFDATTGFRVLKKLATPKGITLILISIVFWSLFDILWMHGLGAFPEHRVIATVAGVPVEEMLLFVLGFYNIAAVFVWAKQRI